MIWSTPSAPSYKMAELLLDSNIRVWVFLPIVVITFLIGIIRHYVTILLSSEKKSDLQQVSDRWVLIKERYPYFALSRVRPRPVLILILMAIRRQDSILGYSVSGHGGEALDVLGAARDWCLKTFNYLATISWAMSTFSFSPVGSRSSNGMRMCVCTELT